MAAGEGRRLRPLTERYAKPVLPIDGRPVIVTLLQELRASGFGRVTVVTGHLAEQVEGLLDGFPLELRFVRQPEPLGSADAVRRGLEALPAVVVAADTVFTPGDLGRFASVEGHAIAGRRDPPPSPPHRYALGVEDGRVTRVLDRRPGESARLGAAVAARRVVRPVAPDRARRSAVRAVAGVPAPGRRGRDRPRRRDRPDPGLDASA